jgi:DNA topoisomerase-1
MYLGPDGAAVRDPQTLERIRSLVIPPAWIEVWICSSHRGHLQATGRDARGRKQYLYHPDWADFRNEVKFAHILQFAEALPLLRRRIDSDLRRRGLPREKILATVVRLLERSLIRVGNEAYQRENNSYGLTTLQRNHVEVETSEIRFAFRGKSGRWHERSVRDRRVARVLRQILDLPGQELFRYVNGDGELRTIASEDVNGYLQEVTGTVFTAKDIRTWHATVCAAAALRSIGPATTASQAKKNIARAVREVAQMLGNRPAASRRYYIHPEILDSYSKGALLPALSVILPEVDERFPPELDALETAVKIFLEWRQKNSFSRH